MDKEVLKFLTYFTRLSRINTCIKDKTVRALLCRRIPKYSKETSAVGRMYISEREIYIVMYSWHKDAFDRFVKPYIECTKLLTILDAYDETVYFYKITGIKDYNYVSELN